MAAETSSPAAASSAVVESAAATLAAHTDEPTPARSAAALASRSGIATRCDIDVLPPRDDRSYNQSIDCKRRPGFQDEIAKPLGGKVVLSCRGDLPEEDDLQ
ncbi:hypothetical protein NJB1728910S_27640 [Mycobacterium marinum]|nr:hypothetical protein NJB1728910S_27640 [Mycobacterium marinum]